MCSALLLLLLLLSQSLLLLLCCCCCLIRRRVGPRPGSHVGAGGRASCDDTYALKASLQWATAGHNWPLASPRARGRGVRGVDAALLVHSKNECTACSLSRASRPPRDRTGGASPYLSRSPIWGS